MRMRPRHLTNLSPEEGDLAVMERWGVAQRAAVAMPNVSAELTKLLSDAPLRAGDLDPLAVWISEQRRSKQEDRLEDAIALATRTEARHRDDGAWPYGLAVELTALLNCLFTHHQREQALVFPILLRGSDYLPIPTIDEMTGVHDDLLARWRRLDHLTGGFRAPAQACAAWRLLYVLCFKLHADCREQVELENQMLLAGRTTQHPG